MDSIKKIRLSKRDFIVDFDTTSLKLEYMRECDKYLIDISDMNLINATRVAILTSTYCFINNFKKKLCWLVKDDEVRCAISILRLRNVEPKIKSTVKKELELALC